MAAYVIQPGGPFQFYREAFDPLVQQACVFGCHSVPEQCHEGGVVSDLTLLGNDRILTKVFDNLHRCDNCLSNKDHARRGDLATVLQQLQNEVGFVLVLAASADLLPQKRDRIETDHEQVHARYFVKPGKKLDLTATLEAQNDDMEDDLDATANIEAEDKTVEMPRDKDGARAR